MAWCCLHPTHHLLAAPQRSRNIPGPGAGLLDVLESMVFPVLTVVLTSFWYLAVEFYFLLSREVLNPYVSYKRAMGLPENRILMSALRAISVPALSIWFSHLIEVEGIVIVVDHLFKLGGLGQMIGSSFSGSMAETFYFVPSLFAFPLLVFIVLNLLIAMAVEFLKTRLDPRGLRHEGEQARTHDGGCFYRVHAGRT